MRGVLCALLCVLAIHARPGAAQPAPNPDAARQLAEQKLKLVEMLIAAPAARAAAAREGESATLIERGKALLGEARDALAAQRHADAAKALDEALRAIAKAKNQGAASASEGVLKQRLQDMSEQAASYRAALAELQSSPKHGAQAKQALATVDALADEARRLAAAGRLGDANAKMAESYRIAIEEISRLRAGEVVTLSLKFNSPAEEYAYEQKRFQSNEILVTMMIAEGRALGDKRRLVDGFVSEAGKFKAEAIDLAINNKYPDAVSAMEQAYGRLNRALQAMGVPAF